MGSRFNPSDEKANCFLGFNPPDGAEEQNDARWGARKACTDLFDLKEESLVPGGGVEPPRSEDRRILSPFLLALLLNALYCKLLQIPL